jgi:hypothetical protein
MGAYQVETNPPIQTMQTPISDVRCKSDDQHNRWKTFAITRPLVPPLVAMHLQKDHRP